MRSFSWLKNLFVFCAGVTALALVCPSNSRAYVASLNADAGHLSHDYKNTLGQKSPFRGLIYGLGLDVGTGNSNSEFRIFFSTFYSQGLLTNASAASETQMTSLLGLGAGIYAYGFKLRGGVAHTNANNTDGGYRMALAGTGTFYSLSYDVYDLGPFTLELGLRSLTQDFPQEKNSALLTDLKSESALYYFSLTFPINFSAEARGRVRPRRVTW